MSYETAFTCFDENCGLVDVRSDMVQWNLNNGLANLTHAVQSDLRNIQSLLNQIVNALNR